MGTFRWRMEAGWSWAQSLIIISKYWVSEWVFSSSSREPGKGDEAIDTSRGNFTTYIFTTYANKLEGTKTNRIADRCIITPQKPCSLINNLPRRRLRVKAWMRSIISQLIKSNRALNINGFAEALRQGCGHYSDISRRIKGKERGSYPDVQIEWYEANVNRSLCSLGIVLARCHTKISLYDYYNTGNLKCFPRVQRRTARTANRFSLAVVAPHPPTPLCHPDGCNFIQTAW